MGRLDMWTGGVTGAIRVVRRARAEHLDCAARSERR